MNIFSVPDALAGAYKGSGHVLMASKAGELIDFIYLRDLLPSFDPDQVEEAIKDHRLAPTIAHLNALGSVSLAMASCWELTEL